MSENTNNNNNSDYIEYYMLNAWWGNDWVSSAFCSNCGIMFSLDILSFNVYKMKGLFFCEPCYKEIKKRHEDHGLKWSGEIYWNSLQQSPELK